MLNTEIPDRWLQGACLVRERQGMGPREAILDAIAWWQDQERMAIEYEAGR